MQVFSLATQPFNNEVARHVCDSSELLPISLCEFPLEAQKFSGLGRVSEWRLHLRK
jgi:hypothetical protein